MKNRIAFYFRAVPLPKDPTSTLYCHMKFKFILLSFLFIGFSNKPLAAQSTKTFISNTEPGIDQRSTILSILEKDHEVYILTQKNGCFLIDQDNKKTTHLLAAPADRKDIFHSLITNGETVFIWANKNEIIPLNTNSKERIIFSTSFFNKTVDAQTIAIDENETIYIGTASDGLFVFSKDETATFNNPKRISTIDQQLPSNRIQCLYRDRQDMIWIGTDLGLASIKGEVVQNYGKSTTTNNHQWAILAGNEDNNGFLSQPIQAINSWGSSLIIAGKNDLYRAMLHTDSIEYLHNYRLTDKLHTPLENINNIMVDIDGNVWIAANQLLRYHIASDKLSVINEVYSLRSNEFLAIAEDLRNRKTWIGTRNNGLFFLKY